MRAPNLIVAAALAAGLYLLARRRNASPAQPGAAVPGGELEEILVTAQRISEPEQPSLWEQVTMTAERAASGLIGAVRDLTKPRGIRNHNPGNLEYLPPNRAWRGQVGTDGRFGIYDSAANGVRAMSKQLQKYEREGLRTVRALISRWAPGHENPTDAYVAAVAKAVGVNPDAPISVHGKLPPLVAAMIRQENGQQPYEITDLQEWVYLA